MDSTQAWIERGRPAHVAIIMDGNGRWARRRGLPRQAGHRAGAENLRRIIRACVEFDVKILTVYAFSTENWQRPKAEVTALMTLLKRFLKSEKQEMIDQNIRLNTIGDIRKLPNGVREILDQTIAATAGNTGLTLTLALSYGGRTEIVDMVREIAGRVSRGETEVAAISEQVIAGALDTRGLPDPDLMIRTSGEIRISNFLLWQASYAELYVTETKWPDFAKENLLQMIGEFQGRERRFGKTGEQVRVT